MNIEYLKQDVLDSFTPDYLLALSQLFYELFFGEGQYDGLRFAGSYGGEPERLRERINEIRRLITEPPKELAEPMSLHTTSRIYQEGFLASLENALKRIAPEESEALIDNPFSSGQLITKAQWGFEWKARTEDGMRNKAFRFVLSRRADLAQLEAEIQEAEETAEWHMKQFPANAGPLICSKNYLAALKEAHQILTNPPEQPKMVRLPNTWFSTEIQSNLLDLLWFTQGQEDAFALAFYRGNPAEVLGRRQELSGDAAEISEEAKKILAGVRSYQEGYLNGLDKAIEVVELQDVFTETARLFLASKKSLAEGHLESFRMAWDYTGDLIRLKNELAKQEVQFNHLDKQRELIRDYLLGRIQGLREAIDLILSYSN